MKKVWLLLSLGYLLLISVGCAELLSGLDSVNACRNDPECYEVAKQLADVDLDSGTDVGELLKLLGAGAFAFFAGRKIKRKKV